MLDKLKKTPKQQTKPQHPQLQDKTDKKSYLLTAIKKAHMKTVNSVNSY